MFSYCHKKIGSLASFIHEIKNISISQWEVEQSESLCNDDFRQQRKING